MTNSPLDLQVIAQILKAISDSKGPISITELTSDPHSKEAESLRHHAEVLSEEEIIETEQVKGKGGLVLSLTKVNRKGREILKLLSDKEVSESLISNMGADFDRHQFQALIEVGQKIWKEARSPRKKQQQKREGPQRQESVLDQWEKDSDSINYLSGTQSRELLRDGARKIIKEEFSSIFEIKYYASNSTLILQTKPHMSVFVYSVIRQRSLSARIDQKVTAQGLNKLESFSYPDHLIVPVEVLKKDLERLAENISILFTTDSRFDKLNEAYLLKEVEGQSSHFESLIEPQIEIDKPGLVFNKNESMAQGVAQEDVTPKPSIIHNPLQLATLSSDVAHKGEDLLEFRHDVEAFASIMSLRELNPPLAIALFGQWGTGKSFFMEKLIEKVRELADNQGFLRSKLQSDLDGVTDNRAPFCEGVCQIKFNAWSYSDTNLWASLVSGIFEGLEEYITKHKREEVAKSKIEKDLSQELELAQEQEKKLSKLKEEKEKEISTLKKKRKKHVSNERSAIDVIKVATMKKVLAEVKDELRDSEELKEVKEHLSELAITQENLEKWSPENLIKEASSWKTFALDFLRVNKKQWPKLGAVLLLILVLALLPRMFQLGWDLSTLGISGTVLFALWKKSQETLQKLKPVITKVVDYKNTYEELLAKKVSEQEQIIEAKKLRITQNRQEIIHIDQQLGLLKKEIHQLEFSLKSTLSQKALYSFILERSNSNDYERHLGIISTIRRDFETLSYLFVESLQELKALKEQSEDNSLNDTDIAIIERKIEELTPYETFNNQFEKPLERIILYIDDLDRCPEERVVEVLEAVNLLMAFPLFVVVVGVDPRWVKNALIKKYQLQFTGRLKDSDLEVEKLGLQVINASDYLEKIFQVPFHLKAPEDASIKNMITHLLGEVVKKKAKDKKEHSLSDHDETEKSVAHEQENAEDASDEVPRSAGFMPSDDESDTSDSDSESDEVPVSEPTDILSKVTPESLELHWEEGEYMRELSWLIGNTPRTVKRFVNMYRIIRAHEGLSYTNDEDKKDLLAILFLLALQIGTYGHFAKNFLDAVFNGRGVLTMGDVVMKGMSDTESEEGSYHNDTYTEFLNTLSNSETFKRLKDASCTEVYAYGAFIKRFSFRPVQLKQF